MHLLLNEDFKDFSLGPFPYDHEHSAMGEYHFYPEKGYKGVWFDPISNWNYKGPSWLITSPNLDGTHFMEQMRLADSQKKGDVPCLRAGDVDWTDYKAVFVFRPLVKGEISGMLFRYQTSMMHYGFYLSKDGAEIIKTEMLEKTVLAKTPLDWDPDFFYEVEIDVSKDNFTCFLNGRKILSATDNSFKNGCIALSACVPTQYKSVIVSMNKIQWDGYMKEKAEKDKKIEEKRNSLPKAKLVKKIDLKNFGAGRQIRFGHLLGTKELFFVIAQHQRRTYKDRYPFISCLTAVSLETGDVLWQIGEPNDDEDVVELTTDLPFQIYDINGDGIDEVIASWDFKIFILDGCTGNIIKSAPTPENTQDPATVTGLEFGQYAFKRLNVDAIRIVNVSGYEKPREIMIKDRYSRLWILDSDLNVKWFFSKYNTGHFPYSYDFDGDGKDEIFSCYNMIDDDGRLMWSLPVHTDHTDEIIAGKMDPDNDEFLAIVSGWEGVMFIKKDGTIFFKKINGHGQRISTGSYCKNIPGLQICTTTYWGNNGIIYMYDCKGNELWHKEALCNGNIIAPVNWNGSGQDLILLNGDAEKGGLIDGDGDVVVTFPNDGHPCLSAEVLDIDSDHLDEIILWDRKSLWIYSQEEKKNCKMKRIYAPRKYEMFNASNYRGEYSFPNWIENS